MSKQSEAVLEENLIRQLSGELGYEKVIIKDESDLLANLKSQLEIHNKITITQSEFGRVLNHLSGGSVFERRKFCEISLL